MMFAVGDLVECVNAEPIICSGGIRHTGLTAASFLRSVGVVGGVARSRVQCGCRCILFRGHLTLAERFRKVTKADAEFTEMLRACKPKVSTLQTDRVEV